MIYIFFKVGQTLQSLTSDRSYMGSKKVRKEYHWSMTARYFCVLGLRDFYTCNVKKLQYMVYDVHSSTYIVNKWQKNIQYMPHTDESC